VPTFWAAGIEDVYLGGSVCSEKSDPGDIDGYWVEPDPDVYERIDPYWIDFELVLAHPIPKWKWPMWIDHGVEFFIDPAMDATAEEKFPQFFRHDREGRPRGVIQVIRSQRDDQERRTKRTHSRSA
jgi:hypothetical protein